MKNVELLAPAGDMESLKCAIYAGANAVYLGAKNFNARAKADNFDKDLKSAVTFCHLYDAKVYLTLNTLIEWGDENELLETVKFALECGVDAFIVQDFGVLNLIKNYISVPVELHASTQMGICNYFGALMAEKMGIKRVVLSRETDLEDIKLIKQNTNLEIEFFVQGALCVCFSGNCYLSGHLFGKSGNRGECLQPCRLPYKAFLKGKQIGSGYLLSAKDFNMSTRLKVLMDAGVDSFKIEGRLRRSTYVGAVTKVYREIIDNNYEPKSTHQVALKKAFNRGDFTPGYLGENANIIDPQIQGHRGINIGTVKAFEKGKKFNLIKLTLNTQLNRGDVLKFIKNGKELATITAYDVSKNKGEYLVSTTAQNIQVGADVNLIVDYQWEQETLKQIKKLPINFTLHAQPNLPIKLSYNFKNICGEIVGEIVQKAQNAPLDYQTAKDSLAKLNDTNFYLQNFEFFSQKAFVKRSEINDLRRRTIDEIMNKYSSNVKVEILTQKLSNDLNNQINNNKNGLKSEKILQNLQDYTIIKPENYLTYDYGKNKAVNYQSKANSIKMQQKEYLYIPSFLRNADILVIEKVLKENVNLGIYVENLSALSLAINLNRSVILGAKLNLKNAFAVKEILGLFENASLVDLVVLSPETDDSNAIKIASTVQKPVALAGFKDFELMTLAHCPIKTLYKNSCYDCKYCRGIEYVMDNNQRLVLKRVKMANCLFYLTLK